MSDKIMTADNNQKIAAPTAEAMMQAAQIQAGEVSTSTQMYLIEQNQSANHAVEVDIKAGQLNKIQVEPGKKYRVVKKTDVKPDAKTGHGVTVITEELQDQVVAVKRGENLQLSYPNGTIVELAGFYLANPAATSGANDLSSVTLPGDGDGTTVLTSDGIGVGVSDVSLGQDSYLLYAHGDASTLQDITKGNEALSKAVGGQDTPAAEPMPESSSAPYVMLAGLLGLGGIAAAVAAGGKGGSSSGSSTTVTPTNTPAPVTPTPAAQTTIGGEVVLGPALAGNGLKVLAFKADGTLLGSATVASNGQYQIKYDATYTGAVLLKVIDVNAAADYMDEATAANKSLDSNLYAVVVPTAGAVNDIHITPLTSLAAKRIGITAVQSNQENAVGDAIIGSPTAAQIAAANIAIAKAYVDQNATSQIVEIKPTLVIDSNGVTQVGDAYGKVLAAISSFEKNNQVTTAQAVDMIHNNIKYAAPSVNAIAGDNVINIVESVNTVITGSNEAGATVSLLIGANHRSATVNGTSWTYTLTSADITALGQGAKVIAVTQTLLQGTQSVVSANNDHAITIDTAAPAGAVIHTVATDDIINAAERTAGVTITGTNEAGATVTVDGAAATVTGTTWSYTMNAATINALGQGAKTLTVVETDTAGNPTTTTKNITIDTAAPAGAVIHTVATDDIINAAERTAGVTITGTNEAGATVTVDGAAATVTGTTWSYTMNAATINALGQGAKTLTVVETDTAGNPTTTTKNITIHTTAAQATVHTVATDDIINAAERTAGVTITGTNEAGATVTVDGAAATVTGTTWSYTMNAATINALGQGAKTLTIVHTNVVGNSATTTKNITIDTAAPTGAVIHTVATDDIINAAERTAGVTITGTNEAGATVTVDGAAATVTGTTWSYTMNAATINALGQGAKTLTVVETDTAGNPTTTTKNITIDTAAPAGAVIHTVATDDIINAAERTAGVTITGTNEAGATVTVDGAAATVTGTTWSYTMNAATINALGQGAKTLTVVETDTAGNPTTTTKNITIDTAAPTGAVIHTVATDDIINAAERTAGVTITGTNEAGATVTVDGAAATVTGTTWSYTMNAATINALGQGAKTLTVVETDTAGNPTTTTKAISIDTQAPVASAAIAHVPVTGVNAHIAVQSTEVGKVYLVKDTLVPTSVANITGAADNLWNEVDVTTPATNTSLATAGLTDGIYHLYAADQVGNLSAISTNAITVDAIAPTVQSVTVSNGNINHDLVAGEQVLVTLVMSEAVTVTGAPTYSIDVGGVAHQATYQSGSGTNSLVFAYTVAAGDVDLVGGITAAANSLLVDQSQHMITDIVGNFANATTSAVTANTNSVRVDTIAPSISNSSAFGVSNLDVTSNIVLKFDSAVTALNTGHISLVNDANGSGKTGYYGESNTNTIDLYFGTSSTANGITTVQTFSDSNRTVASGTLAINDATGVVSINPLRDLDLSNNYHLVVAADSFQKTSNGLKNAAIGADSSLHFSTVSAGNATGSGDISAAANSSVWGADGAIIANGGYEWISIEGIGNPNGVVSIDASTIKPGSSTSNYMFVVHNVSTVANQSAIGDVTGIRFTNLEIGHDFLYVDYQNNTQALPVSSGAILDGYRTGSGEAVTGAIFDVAKSNNNEGSLSYLQFLALTQAQANQAVMFG